jgi:SecD/SecF fusion protein
MKSKGAVKLFAIALTLVCIFQLSFTWVTNKVENEAKEFANGDPVKEREYLDSVARLQRCMIWVLPNLHTCSVKSVS